MRRALYITAAVTCLWTWGGACAGGSKEQRDETSPAAPPQEQQPAQSSPPAQQQQQQSAPVTVVHVDAGPQGAPPPSTQTTATPAPAPDAGPAVSASLEPPPDPKTIPPAAGAPGANEYQQALSARANNLAEAQQLFEKAAQASGGNALSFFNAGVLAERQGKVDDAKRLYMQSLGSKPDFGPAMVNFTLLCLRTQDAARAGQAVSAGLSKTKTDPLVLTAASHYALSQGRNDEAEQHAKAALKIDEKNVEAMRVLARVYFLGKRYELAHFVLRRASDIEPTNALIQQDLGECYLQRPLPGP